MNILLIGPSGGGKTSAVKRHAQERGKPLQIYIPYQEGTDGLGTRFLHPKTHRVVFQVPDWWEQACKEPMVIFLDEITACTSAEQLPILKFSDDSRCLMGHTLHKDTEVIAACNHYEEVDAGSPLSEQVLTRFRHIKLTGNEPVEFAAGKRGVHIDYPIKPPSAEVWGIYNAFLKAKPGAINASREERRKAVERQTPYACGRSWDRAVREEGSIEHFYQYVGEDAALEILTFSKQIDMPNLVDLFAGRITADSPGFIPKRGDAVVATSGSILHMLGDKPSPESIKTAMNWWWVAGKKGHVARCIDDVQRVATMIGYRPTGKGGLGEFETELEDYASAIR